MYTYGIGIITFLNSLFPNTINKTWEHGVPITLLPTFYQSRHEAAAMVVLMILLS